MRSQRDAVVTFILQVLSDRGVEYELNGETPVTDVLTPEDKKVVRELVTQGFLNGEIVLSEAAQAKFLPFPSELAKYVHGLVNNWIKKYKPFNCGQAYVPKNKGSRTGYQDPQIKALRALKKKPGLTAEQVNQIDAAIAERLEELKPKVEISVSDVPEHLRHLV
jgi:hypothetical protein